MRAQSLLTLVKNMRRSKGPIGTAWPQLHTQNCPTLSQIVCPPHLHLPLPLTRPPPCFVEPSTVSVTFLIFPLAICVQQLSGDPWFYAGIYNSVHNGYISFIFATLNPLTLEGTDNTSLYCLHLRSCLRPSISCTKL